MLSRAPYQHSGHFRCDQVSNISLCTYQHVTGLARQWHHFCNEIQQKLIFQNSIRARYHKLTAIDSEELLIYKIIIFFPTYVNWKIVYADAVIICLELIHSDLACYWVENIYVRFLLTIIS